MTRINCVPPSELHSKHLVAEYRELPRIFAMAEAAAARGETPDDPRNPRKYVLGSGHVRFFYGRLGYLTERFNLLVDEMLRRGYNVSFRRAPEVNLPETWFGTWHPTDDDLALNRARIAERSSWNKT